MGCYGLGYLVIEKRFGLDAAWHHRRNALSDTSEFYHSSSWQASGFFLFFPFFLEPPARSQYLLHSFKCVCLATGRAQSFFSHANFKTRFFSRLSASIFLNSVVSRSSSFSLLASLTSIWPN